MAKPRPRGLPSSFQIGVSAATLSAPVELGEYLDDVPLLRPERRPPVQPAAEPAQAPLPTPAIAPVPHVPPVEARGQEQFPDRPPLMSVEPRQPAPSRALVAPSGSPRRAPVEPPLAPQYVEESFAPATAKPSPPRKQVNMNPETLRMVDELLHHIQSYSGQKDAKASEMFHGLVSALYDSRAYLNFSDVPPRGQWGSPTARAFPIALKKVFRDAIAEWCARNRR